MNNVINFNDHVKKVTDNVVNTEHVHVNDIADYRSIVLWLMDLGATPKLLKHSEDEYEFRVHRDSSEFTVTASDRYRACEIAVNAWIDLGSPEIWT